MFLREYSRENNRIYLRCEICGEIVAEYICNESGIPYEVVYDESADHVCKKGENE